MTAYFVGFHPTYGWRGDCCRKMSYLKRSISQEGLADMANLARSTMGLVERGEKSPSIQTIAKVANALDIDIYKLFIFDE